MTTPPSVDGVSSGSSEPAAVTPAGPSPKVERTKRMLMMLLLVVYVVYGSWSFILMTVLPSPDGGKQELIQAGMFGAMVGGGVFLLIGLVGMLRIRNNKELPVSAKQQGLLRTGMLVLPGLILSGVVPFMINREPPIVIEVVKPLPEDMIAPVAVTFSAEQASKILLMRGSKVLKYQWDVDGDGKMDRETVTPTLTTTYQREGTFVTNVTLGFVGGGGRKLSKRIVIQKAVFTYDPQPSIVNQPTTFDASNLVQSKSDIQLISWDFDNDGSADVEGKETEATTTFYKTGTYPVSVTLRLNDNTQSQYQRVIEVVEPPPLPFPVEISTEPKNLYSPAPFQVIFSVKTDVPLSDVQWNFGDGGKASGAKAAHTFTKKGDFIVVAKVRSKSGTGANVAVNVKIAELLNIPDLKYKGEPLPNGDTISGEVPLTVSLEPQTSMQFVNFLWEAPGATEVGSTEGKLQAIYREAENYFITLIAQDPEERVLRKTFKVEVKPITALVRFNMDRIEGVAPLRVKFDASETDIPGEEISGFEWDFGDGTPKIPSGATTEHVFSEAGSYQVTLTVKTNSGDKESSASRNLLVRVPPLKACVLASRTRGSTPVLVKFDSSCTEGVPDKFEWDFKDGGRSTDKNPLYKFEKAGVYPVELTVTDSSGRKSTADVTITAE